ncbi:serine/threonine-protein kinase [Nonomuraea angiospora]|uniref:Serine/threonine protein kinase n=1 Tax=Nonomuraea angiospora TaxID=46172 RepID=A0ABR9MKJ6_9ACTN|nr:serine/threonine-protein kinase [Nonomuraea angiospora]MBE1593038.1 serine/threonine protein kinase [Nonomuraea angiospora]
MASPLRPDDPPSLGDYRLSGRLGEGGQGVVYLAQTAAGEPVAIKLLSAGDQQTRARLARELDALEGIASFCTARVLDVSADGPRPFVVSEFVDGPSLADRVRERGPLRGGDLERLAVGTATALAAIHAAGIVHRDFKPANVLLGPDGPRVVDFGIARAEGAATMTSGLIGTPAYLAPEQIGGSPASPASDVFAWASSMLFAATGTSPFGADTVPAVLHRVLHVEPDLAQLPPRLRGVIASCLVKDPSRRPTAQHLMMSLVNPNAPPAHLPQGPAVPESLGTGPRPQAAITTQGTGGTRSRGLLIGALAVLVALAAAVVTMLSADRTPTSLADQGDHSSSPVPPESPAPSTPPESPPESRPESPPESADSTTPAASGGKLKIPAAYAGTWTGRTRSTNPMDTDGAENTVVLKPGASTAQWSEKDAGVSCRGTITLTQVEASRLTFSLEAMEGGCIPGTVWLAKQGDAVSYTWRDEPGPGIVTQTGTLSKT